MPYLKNKNHRRKRRKKTRRTATKKVKESASRSKLNSNKLLFHSVSMWGDSPSPSSSCASPPSSQMLTLFYHSLLEASAAFYSLSFQSPSTELLTLIDHPRRTEHAQSCLDTSSSYSRFLSCSLACTPTSKKWCLHKKYNRILSLLKFKTDLYFTAWIIALISSFPIKFHAFFYSLN